MISFFDTCVHVAILRGDVALDQILSRVEVGPVRLSPVVASELLRGSRRSARRAVERLVASMASVEPPAWRSCFHEAGRVLRDVFARHEEVGLARLQNDVLLALTSRHTGALLVTFDAHFADLRRHFPFPVVVLAGPELRCRA